MVNKYQSQQTDLSSSQIKAIANNAFGDYLVRGQNLNEINRLINILSNTTKLQFGDIIHTLNFPIDIRGHVCMDNITHSYY